ncbi:hypothetical protein DYB32_008311, partial [Aphanomyces invadans]
RAEAELDNLPIGFIHEDEAADVDAAQRLSLTTDSRPHELVDTIQAMAAELEAAKASARKLQTVQLHRIVTLSTHLSKVASELLLLRKKLVAHAPRSSKSRVQHRSGAEVAFWKTECEKLDRELLCLVTEFNLYKSNHMIDGYGDARPSKRASALASLPGAPPPSPKQSSSPTKRRRSSASSKPRLLSARIPTGDAALALDSTSPTSPELDHGALSTADDRDKSLPRAFELTAVDEVTEASNQSPHDMVPDDIHVPTAPLDNTLLLIEGGSPLSTATALQSKTYTTSHRAPDVCNMADHARLQVTTQDTPPASAMAQASIPLESQDENNNPPVHDDGRFLDSLHAPNPAEQNPKELQYLKSLAGNRTDTLRSLAMTQWEVLVLQLQLLALHARTVEMKERRVRFNRPHNRTTKFQYDKDKHAYSFMHVTKLVYPKSAGPTKTPFELKPSVQVAGIRVPPPDDVRTMLLHPKDDFDQVRPARPLSFVRFYMKRAVS